MLNSDNIFQSRPDVFMCQTSTKQQCQSDVSCSRTQHSAKCRIQTTLSHKSSTQPTQLLCSSGINKSAYRQERFCCHCKSMDVSGASFHGRIQRGGQGVWTPLKNHKNIEFLSNTGPDPLKNYKDTKLAFNVGSLSAHQRNTL